MGKQYAERFFPDDASFGEARQWARDNALSGCICPLCRAKIKAYWRVLGYATAKLMIAIYRTSEPGEYVYTTPLLDQMTGTPQQGGYNVLAHHWGLLEAMPGKRKDGSKRMGWWRLTDKGRDFVEGRRTEPRRAFVIRNNAIEFDGPQLTISDAFGEPFDYRETMGDNE